MRSTEDLIAELDEEAKEHFTCCIAVGFEESSIFIRSADADRLRLLNEAIVNGGIPMGLIAVDKSEGTLTVKARIYHEHAAAHEQATAYMDRLLARFKELLVREYT